MSRRLLVLGLDGACLQIVEPLARAGRLPHLAAWLREGHSAPLRSTVPPMSFPAWSTFLTGLEPGEHGLFDFTQKLPGAYRIRFTNASDRSGETLFGRATRAGRGVLALGVPGTFPPEPVSGLLVSGFDAPVSTGSDARSASDPALYSEIAAEVGPWMAADLDEAATGGTGLSGSWHEHAARRLVARVERKKCFALEALSRLTQRDGTPPALACIVFSESDTVAHHFWRDHDPDSPRHDPAASALRRGAVADVYAALDAACGELRAAFGDDAECAVVSDHGSGGAARHVVHLGRRLAEAGLLARTPARPFDTLARVARDRALRWLPPAAAERIFRRARGTAARVESLARFGGVDWQHSVAFSEEVNTQPGVWINLRGRESAGCVAPADYERARDDVIACLVDWKLPTGEPVVARARRREDVYSGPHVERAPDVVVELGSDAGYGLSLVATPWHGEESSVRRLSDAELAGGRGRGMNGTHRPDGLWIASAAAERAWTGDREPRRLRDVAPTLLATLGLDWEPPGATESAADTASTAYTPEEEARVAERLRALGYLE